MHFIYQLSYRNGLGFKNALVYGVGKTGKQLARYLNKEVGLGYKVVGYIDESFHQNPIESGTRRLPEILGSHEDIGTVTSRYDVDDMFIAMPSATVDQISQIVESCNGLLRQYHFVPQLKKVNLNRLRLGSIDGIPFCGVRKYRKNYFKNFIKRLFDLIFSGIFLITMAPIFAIIALKIRCSSDGPIIFKQKRVGKNGKLFTMYKFRSMYLDTAAYAQTPQDTDDPRITPFGRFLRRTSLDELPQFLNVFLGQMSVVGPRPEMKFIVDQYNALQRERLKVKPGITGPWQISLDRTRPIHEAIEHDLYYIENQSLRLDLRIIWETFIFCIISVFKKLNF